VKEMMLQENEGDEEGSKKEEALVGRQKLVHMQWPHIFKTYQLLRHGKFKQKCK
jgi:hypothetical protein